MATVPVGAAYLSALPTPSAPAASRSVVRVPSRWACSRSSSPAARRRNARICFRVSLSRSDTARSDSSRRRYPQPVAIEVLELTLSPGKPFFVDRDAELLGNGVNVLNVQVDERVRASITLVLRK